MRKESHYTWLERNFKTIVERLGLDVENPGRHWGNFTADGDKYYSYQFDWERAGISWYHGAAMYHLMVTYFYKEIRDTKDGWVDPKQWVIDNYNAGHNLGRVMQDL